ncbi:uncharacterized protein LOC113333789 isoform X2 [Papaver somniferum]|uniref:uncharacterized protein LOC113333789 isoform X2 n=1 Tax=Papaver somniferum TaxID=3469 RepID=UPI000E6F99DA|nr:uncharacterized protein LOC113333789 isoform X2 [Papaver somniferum]
MESFREDQETLEVYSGENRYYVSQDACTFKSKYRFSYFMRQQLVAYTTSKVWVQDSRVQAVVIQISGGTISGKQFYDQRLELYCMLMNLQYTSRTRCRGS